MNSFFSKKSKKDDVEDPRPPSRTTSPTKKSSSSPTKPSRGRDEPKSSKSAAATSSARSSRSFTAKSKPESGDSRHGGYDPNSHPLNLPPDQLRRLSALVNMSEPTPMDVDAAEVSSSPQPVPMDIDTETLSTSQELPKTNGVNNVSNDDVPPPPAHKSGPSSPVAEILTAEDAEAFKLAGNKFFKAKDYKKAIEEYTKGAPQ